jgi:tripartite-type tricarboxylate transporter receptor subunit TctC
MNRMLTTLAAGCSRRRWPRRGRQDYPTQTIKLISSFGAGGGSDIVARIIAPRLQDKLGQSVVVENRPGAGGLLGNEAVANSPKDGYTLGVQTAGQIITPGDDQERALRAGGVVRLDRADRGRRPP